MKTLVAALPDIILLSATSSGEATGFVTALSPVGNMTFLEWQIRQFMEIGITRFLVEVETIPGVLAELANRLLKKGVSLEFVRQGKDLQAHLVNADQILCVAANIHPTHVILAELRDQPRGVVLLLDHEAASDNFERIDLNFRWAGLACIPTSLLSSLHDIPDDYALTSSLLRLALQASVPTVKLPPDHLQTGALRYLGDSEAVQQLLLDDVGRHGGAPWLSGRPAGRISGLDRAFILPLARAVASRVWAQPLLASWIAPTAALFALLACILGTYAMLSLAVSAAVISAVLLGVSSVLDVEQGLQSRLLRYVGWALLSLLFLIILWRLSGGVMPMATVGVGVILLTIHGLQQTESGVAQISPIILVVLCSFGTFLTLLVGIVQVILLIQIAILIWQAQKV